MTAKLQNLFAELFVQDRILFGGVFFFHSLVGPENRFFPRPDLGSEGRRAERRSRLARQGHRGAAWP
jgi:hypothetical protein